MAHDRISRDPAVLMGKPVIKGTRITVELILRACAGGATVEEIVDSCPNLVAEDVSAALAWTAEYLSREGLISPEEA